MRKYLLLVLSATTVFLSSCSKSLEERIVGSWQLEETWKKIPFGRDHFTTGYENGIFTFEENGNASYISPTDTLTGQWRSARHNAGYYNSNGEWQSQGMKYLRISLVNFQQNKWLEWDFDDFHFHDTWQEIRAEQYSLSNDRVYEFERR
jgi:hypothetical protein